MNYTSKNEICQSVRVRIYKTIKCNGKLYYYLTNDDHIAVDDQVVVPVGNKGKQRICNVEKVEYYTADEVPMPIDIRKQKNRPVGSMHSSRQVGFKRGILNGIAVFSEKTWDEMS